MNITRWDPFKELEGMSSRLNRIFGNTSLQGSSEELSLADWQPSVDVKETPEEFVIKAELPEVKKEDIKLTVEAGVLSLRGERRHEKEQKDAKYHRIERGYGSFQRSFTLPDNVEVAKIHAESKDGLLIIALPKAAQVKAKSVEVKVQ